MQDFVSNLFVVLGLLIMAIIFFIDRKYPGETPIPPVSYYAIIIYMIIIKVGPEGVKGLTEQGLNMRDKLSDFSISIGKKGQKDSTKKD